MDNQTNRNDAFLAVKNDILGMIRTTSFMSRKWQHVPSIVAELEVLEAQMRDTIFDMEKLR